MLRAIAKPILDTSYQLASPSELPARWDPSITTPALTVEQMIEAVKDGVDLRGYYPWGPIDIISCSSSEIEKRYGFIYVDLDNDGKGTGKRSLKDSYAWYKKVVASNGRDLG